MISGDTILFALMVVTGINMIRYLTTLRSLIHIMREAHPLLYQQVDGNGLLRKDRPTRTFYSTFFITKV